MVYLIFAIIYLVIVNIFLSFITIKIVKMNSAELAAALTKIGQQLSKAIEEVKSALKNAGNTTPEIDAALNNVAQVAQQLDDLNPDAPVE